MRPGQTLAMLLALDLFASLTGSGWLFTHTVEQEILTSRYDNRRWRLRYPPYYRWIAQTFPVSQRIWGPPPSRYGRIYNMQGNITGFSEGQGDAFGLRVFSGEIPTQTDWWHDIDGPVQYLEVRTEPDLDFADY